MTLLGAPLYTLRIREATEGRELAAIPMSRGERFKVEYVHSMYKVKQSEIFSIGPDLRFHLEEVTFGSYAAAAYYDSDPSHDFAFEGGLWTVTGGGNNYSVLKYRVSPSTGHVLTLGDQIVELSGYAHSWGGVIEMCLEREGGN